MGASWASRGVWTVRRALHAYHHSGAPLSTRRANHPTGLFLSLLVLRLNTWLSQFTPAYTSRSTIEHLSVHTGKVAKAIPVPPSLMGVPDEADWRHRAHRPEWWHMEWVDGGSKWEKPKVSVRFQLTPVANLQPGSALMLLDVLPRVTPVDPPKPAVYVCGVLQYLTPVLTPLHPHLQRQRT